MSIRRSVSVAVVFLAAASAQTPQAPLSQEQVLELIKLLQQQNPAPAPNAPSSALSVIARSGSQQFTLTARDLQQVFVPSKSNDVADALKTEAMSRAIGIGTSAAIQKIGASVPYLGSMTSVVGALKLGGSKKQQGWEFDFLRGVGSEVQIKDAGVEFVLPATAEMGNPVLLRLKVMEKDKVRLIAAKKVQLMPRAPSPFGGEEQGGTTTEQLSSEVITIPTTIEKPTTGGAILRPSQPLIAGEYVIAFQKPEPKTFRLHGRVFDFRTIE